LLPSGVLDEPYTQTLEASGGQTPYQWTLIEGNLPEGLSLSGGGALSGAPTQEGAFNFVIRVVDSSDATTTKVFRLDVRSFALPVLSFSGLADIVRPAEQPVIQVSVAEPSATQIQGLLTLTFTPDADIGVDDPAIQFSTGGRTAEFVVPANQTEAPAIMLQTGTVAGTIRVSAAVSIPGEQEPVPVFEQTVRIDRVAPVITAVAIARTGGGLELRVTGFATTREVAQGTFRFNPTSGAGFAAFDVAVTMAEAAQTWYANEASRPFGSTFLLVQPFQVSGSLAQIQSITVTMSNGQGTSAPVTTNLP
jgi:hypothetical protein